jgi:hypothetical protein
MWEVKRLQGLSNKWAVSRNGMLKGHVTVDENGRCHGQLNLPHDDVFQIVNQVQDMIASELADEELLMKST